jgi:hypothetical protein
VLESARDMPPEARDLLENMQAGTALGLSLLFSFITMLVAGCFFGLVGGLIGALVFKRNAPAVPPPPPPPPIPQA